MIGDIGGKSRNFTSLLGSDRTPQPLDKQLFITYLKSRNIKDAIKVISENLELPEQKELLIKGVYFFKQLKDPELAEQLLIRLVELGPDPTDGDCFIEIAKLYIKEENVEAAKRIGCLLRSCGGKFNKGADQIFKYVVAFYVKHDASIKAESFVEEVSNNQVFSSECFCYIAHDYYCNKEDRESAIRVALKVDVSIKKSYNNATILLGEIFRNYGSDQELEEAIEIAKVDASRSGALLKHILWGCRQRGDLVAAFRAAIEIKQALQDFTVAELPFNGLYETRRN
ncbi:MAG: tetratricopeptide repeat protein [Chlamydiia bacterium]